MVNSGKPSGRCASCKKRKIKCDEQRPGCSQCEKAGWVCPGYKDATELIFRHETQHVIERVRREEAEQRKSSSRWQSRQNSPRCLSPGLIDSGTAFFFHQYVTDGGDHVDTSSRGNHEYLPKLLSSTTSGVSDGKAARKALETITAAAGLAALANSSCSQKMLTEAYGLYGKAIRQIQHALRDSFQVHADETLAAVMLMGTFEMIASADQDSVQSFSHHTIAAAKLIEQRGPQQFKSPQAVRLFHQLRRLIIMTSMQMQEEVPWALRKWSQWAGQIQKPDEFYANQFGQINGRIAALRARIKHQHITSPPVVSTMLLPLDEELVSWKSQLPQHWRPKLYHLLKEATGRSLTDALDSQLEIYPDLWVASMWNNYRVIRILIHETIMSITLKFGSREEKSALQPSIDVLKDMATQVCRSVAFHLGTYQNRKPANSDPNIHTAIPGGYLLAWPLFLAGMLRTTPREQKAWMASRMHYVAMTMGLRLAHSFAEVMRIPDDKSFGDPDVWIIGGMWPQ